MTKKIFIFLVIAIVAFAILAYNNNTTAYKSFNISPDYRDICYYKNQVYYIYDNSINSYNVDTKKNKKLYTYNDIKENFYINELCVNNEFLLWVEINSDNESNLIKYNKNNDSIMVIRESTQSKSIIPICLTISNSNVATWYESEYNEKTEELNERIIIYDLEKDTIIEKKAYLHGNPYLRPYIENNNIAYPFKENNKNFIDIYNIKIKTSKKIECVSEIAKMISNGEYTIWLDNYNDRNIYIYDNTNDSYEMIEGSLNIFTFTLINDILYISYTRDQHGYPNIESINLKTREQKSVTNNDNINNIYYISKPNVENKFMYQLVKEESLKLFIKMK